MLRIIVAVGTLLCCFAAIVAPLGLERDFSQSNDVVPSSNRVILDIDDKYLESGSYAKQGQVVYAPNSDRQSNTYTKYFFDANEWNAAIQAHKGNKNHAKGTTPRNISCSCYETKTSNEIPGRGAKPVGGFHITKHYCNDIKAEDND